MKEDRPQPKIKEIKNRKGEIIGLEIKEFLTFAEIRKYYPDYYKECQKAEKWLTKEIKI